MKKRHTVGAILLCLLVGTQGAVSIEPSTAISAIGTAASLIDKLISGSRFETWKGQIKTGIDTIVSQNALILAELEELKNLIPRIIEKQFQAEHVKKLKGEANQFDTYVVSVRKNQTLLTML